MQKELIEKASKIEKQQNTKADYLLTINDNEVKIALYHVDDRFPKDRGTLLVKYNNVVIQKDEIDIDDMQQLIEDIRYRATQLLITNIDY